MIVLLVGENRMIVASFVLTQYQRVTEDRQTDSRTDGQTDRLARSYYSRQHSKLCRRAVTKIKVQRLITSSCTFVVD